LHDAAATFYSALVAVSTQRRRDAKAIRAARGWSGYTQADFAAAIGVNVADMRRLERGERPFPDELRDRVSRVAAVPRDFLDVGFPRPPRPSSGRRARPHEHVRPPAGGRLIA
jgi:transcriptional regulator with XRE-family HTH domain